jgi:hypothetical protein
MRNMLWVGFAAVGLLLILGPAAAYALVPSNVVAKVPFAFTVADKTFPAGEYVISAPDATEPRLLEVHQKDGPLGVLVLAHNVSPAHATVNTELIFNRIGDREFLSQVWTEGSNTGSQVVKSREEIQLEKSQTSSVHHQLPASNPPRTK